MPALKVLSMDSPQTGYLPSTMVAQKFSPGAPVSSPPSSVNKIKLK